WAQPHKEETEEKGGAKRKSGGRPSRSRSTAISATPSSSNKTTTSPTSVTTSPYDAVIQRVTHKVLEEAPTRHRGHAWNHFFAASFIFLARNSIGQYLQIALDMRKMKAWYDKENDRPARVADILGIPLLKLDNIVVERLTPNGWAQQQGFQEQVDRILIVNGEAIEKMTDADIEAYFLTERDYAEEEDGEEDTTRHSAGEQVSKLVASSSTSDGGPPPIGGGASKAFK
ncbi:unnamed protein product, partial [Amoebophrya sp. A25]